MADDQNKAPMSKHDEAQALAREALEEQKAGNKDEAAFVLEEATKLDKEAVEEVVHPKASA